MDDPMDYGIKLNTAMGSVGVYCYVCDHWIANDATLVSAGLVMDEHKNHPHD